MSDISRLDKTIIIALEGTIAAGKSTILQYLSQFGTIATFSEQIRTWCKVPGVPEGENSNLLQLFYENQEQYGFAFQMLAMMTQYQNQTTRVEVPIKVVERSVSSSFHVFATLLKENKALTTIEYALLEQLLNHFEETGSTKPDYIFYVDTPPTAAAIRLEKRGRAEERQSSAISHDYLVSLNDKYERFLSAQSIPVVRINGMQDTTSMCQEVFHHLHQIHPLH
jgi:deoxyadenosine/deoxycytidine kinase